MMIRIGWYSYVYDRRNWLLVSLVSDGCDADGCHSFVSLRDEDGACVSIAIAERKRERIKVKKMKGKQRELAIRSSREMSERQRFEENISAARESPRARAVSRDRASQLTDKFFGPERWTPVVLSLSHPAVAAAQFFPSFSCFPAPYSTPWSSSYSSYSSPSRLRFVRFVFLCFESRRIPVTIPFLIFLSKGAYPFSGLNSILWSFD